LSVKEAELAMRRRHGASERSLLDVQGNLSITYQALGRFEEASRIQRDVYSGHVKLSGEEHIDSLGSASNYASSLIRLQRFEEAKAVLRKTVPVARRILRDSHELTLMMRLNYARALYHDPSVTLEDLREAVTTFEEMDRTARRVLGGAHPITGGIGRGLQNARAKLREALAAMTPRDAQDDPSS